MSITINKNLIVFSLIISITIALFGTIGISTWTQEDEGSDKCVGKCKIEPKVIKLSYHLEVLELGKRDALDNLIHSLYHTIENLDEKTNRSTKSILTNHLEKAKESFQKESDSYEEVMNHLYGFIDEINRMELDNKLTAQHSNLFRP